MHLEASMPSSPPGHVITLSLNPTIDRILEVPGLRVGDHLQGRLLARQPAGKAVNVSRALVTLWTRSTVVGWVAADTAALLEDFLEDMGVRARLIPIAGQARENITLIDPQAGTETHIRDVGPTVTPPDVSRLVEVLDEVADERCLAVVTGSAPPGLSPDGWAGLVEGLLGRGATVAVDASGELLRRAAERPVWLLKPNLRELGELVGRRVESQEEILEIGRRLNRQIAVVLVTLGSGGAYAFAEGRVWRGRTRLPQTEVRSTVGCGDSFLAGFLAGCLDPGRPMPSRLQQALAVAAASALTDRPAVFEPDAVRSCQERTEVVEIT